MRTEAFESVRNDGLLRDKTSKVGQRCQNGGCISIAETAEIVACFGDVVLVR